MTSPITSKTQTHQLKKSLIIYFLRLKNFEIELTIKYPPKMAMTIPGIPIAPPIAAIPIPPLKVPNPNKNIPNKNLYIDQILLGNIL